MCSECYSHTGASASVAADAPSSAFESIALEPSSFSQYNRPGTARVPLYARI